MSGLDWGLAGIALGWILFVALCWRITRPHPGHHAAPPAATAERDWRPWPELGAMNLADEPDPTLWTYMDDDGTLQVLSEAPQEWDDEAWERRPWNDAAAAWNDGWDARSLASLREDAPVSEGLLGRSDGGVARPVQRATAIWPMRPDSPVRMEGSALGWLGADHFSCPPSPHDDLSGLVRDARAWMARQDTECALFLAGLAADTAVWRAGLVAA